MVKIPFKFGYDDTEVRQGFRDLKSMGSQVAAGLGVAFAAFTVEKIVADLKNVWVGLQAENLAFERLEKTLQKYGATADEASRQAERMDRIQRITGEDAGELAKALEDLTIKSGSAEAGIANLGLAMDVSKRFGLDMGTSVNVVSAAATGQLRQIGELLPYMKEWSANNRELTGTAEGATAALGALNEAAGGMVKSELGEWTVQLEKAKSAWGEIKEEMVKNVVGAESVAAAYERIADALNYILINMKNSKGFLGLGGFDVEQARKDAEAYEAEKRRGLETTPPKAGRVTPEDPRDNWTDEQKEWDGNVPQYRSNPWFRNDTPVGSLGGGPGGPRARMGEQNERELFSLTEEYTEAWRKHYEERQKLSREDADRLREQVEQYKAQIGSIGAEMKNVFGMAWDSFLQDGKVNIDQIKDYMIRKLGMFLLGKAADALAPGVGSIFGIGVGAAGGSSASAVPKGLAAARAFAAAAR